MKPLNGQIAGIRAVWQHMPYGILLLISLGMLVGCGDKVAPESGSDANESDVVVYSEGLSEAYMQQAVERAEALPQLQSLLVARHGEIQAEHRFNGPGLDTPVNVKSLSKSLLSALVGIAIENGDLDSVDQPIAPFFAEHLDEESDPRKQEITIGHLLSMQSGLERTSGSNYGGWVASSNWVRNAIRRPMESDPGTRRRYSTGNTHLISAILTQATGESTWAFAKTHLADPLDIRLPRWPTDPQGIYFGGNDMVISPRALVRFGEMYRTGGQYNGTHIVSNGWIQTSWMPRAQSRWSGAGYGYGWFKAYVGKDNHPMYYGWGYGGQYLFIVPRLEMTVVATSDPYGGGGREHRRVVQEIITEEIIRAAEEGGTSNDTL